MILLRHRSANSSTATSHHTHTQSHTHTHFLQHGVIVGCNTEFEKIQNPVIENEKQISPGQMMGWRWTTPRGWICFFPTHSNNSLRPGDASKDPWNGSLLVWVMVRLRFSAKFLPELMLTYSQLDPREQTSVTFWSNEKVNVRNLFENIVCNKPFLFRTLYVNSLRLVDAYIHQSTGCSLALVMACRLFWPSYDLLSIGPPRTNVSGILIMCKIIYT